MQLRGRTNHREHISKSMKCRRRRQNPFQSTSNSLFVICCPRIVCTLRSICKSQIHDVEKVYKTHSTQIRPIRTNDIPPQECVRIVKVASWHSSESLEMLRKECQVYPNEKLKELSLTMMFWILTSCQFPYPEIKSCKNSRNCTHTQYIMKMSYYIISHSLFSTMLWLCPGIAPLFLWNKEIPKAKQTTP